jgi:hypothetical protein
MPAATVYNCRDKRTKALPNPQLLSTPCVVLLERQKLEEGPKGASKGSEGIANHSYKLTVWLGGGADKHWSPLACGCQPRMKYHLAKSRQHGGSASLFFPVCLPFRTCRLTSKGAVAAAYCRAASHMTHRLVPSNISTSYIWTDRHFMPVFIQ